MEVDPKGSLPKFLINIAQEKQVQNVLRIKEVIMKEIN